MDELSLADKDALGIRHGSMRATFWRGYNHQKAGGSKEDCPYCDKRNSQGAPTFSRAWGRVWLQGYAAAEREGES